MKAFEIPDFYRSPLITCIKQYRRKQDKLKKDFSPTRLDFGTVEIYLARHFGFCYGVENAIEIAFKAVNENPGKRIFLLSEMIHNPQVNADLIKNGVSFIMDTHGKHFIDWDELNQEDIVIIPAFGTTLETEKILTDLGIDPLRYNTTCPFVEKVWNRSEQIGQKGYTIIIHGKPGHEETRATFSHSREHAPSVVVKDFTEAQLLAKYITGEKPMDDFFTDFSGQYSKDFNPLTDLQRIGVVNQTTMLASDTQQISDYLKQVITQHHSDESQIHFADTRDTLCYATNDNQSAVVGLLETRAHLALVVGGYNSSNTSHLVELCEQKLPTYYIENAHHLVSDQKIKHFDLHLHKEIETLNYLPEVSKPKILMTSGASCPDAMVEQVINRVLSFYPGSLNMDQMIQQISSFD
ncbi:MAG: 4-hydroxy-3-methylbut-2-enyl diphosphate reductase [Chitinophagaceae bacterium]|nr:4-hydroxy-3-methylbut-2-enyl diphosphate reductase [Chitinophagaceae bacterium]